MGSRYLFVALLVLVACQTAIETVPTSEYVPKVQTSNTEISVADDLEIADPCANLTCPESQNCNNGKCGCESDEKMCDELCINKSDCCTSDDCDQGSCQNGSCIDVECKRGLEFSNGECVCEKGTVMCNEQERCITQGDCCIHSQCPRNNRCVETMLRTSLCIEIGQKKVCKAVADNKRAEIFDVLDHDFRINANDWWADGSISFIINDEDIRIAKNETIDYAQANATIFFEEIQTIGGHCKEVTEE